MKRLTDNKFFKAVSPVLLALVVLLGTSVTAQASRNTSVGIHVDTAGIGFSVETSRTDYYPEPQILAPVVSVAHTPTIYVADRGRYHEPKHYAPMRHYPHKKFHKPGHGPKWRPEHGKRHDDRRWHGPDRRPHHKPGHGFRPGYGGKGPRR